MAFKGPSHQAWLLSHNNMGNALQEQGGWRRHYRLTQSYSVKPDYAEAYYIAFTLKEEATWRGDRAYNKALAIKPDYAEAYNNMGVTLKEQVSLKRRWGLQ